MPFLPIYWLIFWFIYLGLDCLGIYHSAISAFLKMHCYHRASNHALISKLIHKLNLQCPPSHEWFDLWDVKWLLSLLDSWAPASSITNFKLAWKTATLFTLIMAKHCSDLTLPHVNNQHPILQCHAVILVPASGGKMGWPGHLLPQICIESYSIVNLCPVFLLEGFLCHTNTFRKKSDRSWMPSPFSWEQ